MKRLHWMQKNRFGRTIIWLGDTFNNNIGFILIIILIAFGFTILGFQKSNQKLLSDTRATVKNTEVIVVKQDQTLDAIAKLALDNQISSEQLRDILLCMLIVPIERRTTDVADSCRTQAENDAANITPRPSETRPVSRRETSPVEEPTQSEIQEPLLQRTVDNVTGVVNGVINSVRDLTQLVF